MTAWVGVDPGARATGVVLRQGNDLLWWTVVERHTDEGRLGVGPGYVHAVLAAVRDACAVSHYPARVAVEEVTPPNPHVTYKRRDGSKGYARPRPADLQALATVYGGVLADHPWAVIVPPGGNGARPLSLYPYELVTDAERRAKGGMHRAAGHSATVNHARSAWDVAGQATTYARINAAREAQP